jgi:hypothetical protein
MSAGAPNSHRIRAGIENEDAADQPACQRTLSALLQS